MTRFWVPVRSSSTEANWPVRPMFSRTLSAWVRTSNPLTRAVPASARSKVARMRTAVVLPAPFGPSRPSTVPLRTARSTSASALVSPKDFLSPVASIASSVMRPVWAAPLTRHAHLAGIPRTAPAGVAGWYLSPGGAMDRETVGAYLNRVGVAAPAGWDAAALRTLHRAHQLTVPFENLSLHLAEPVSLAEPDLIDKIVRRRRGGFCYELNGAFALLLEALGAQVSRGAARVFGAGGRRRAVAGGRGFRQSQRLSAAFRVPG